MRKAAGQEYLLGHSAKVSRWAQMPLELWRVHNFSLPGVKERTPDDIAMRT